MGRRPETLVLHEAELDEGAAAPAAVRRWPVLALVAVIGLTASLFSDPDAAGDPDLLGRLDDTTGRTSRLPPLDDLQVLWQRPVDVGTSTTVPVPEVTRVGPDHLRLGDEVVDLRTGQVTATLPPRAAVSPTGQVALVDDGDLVRVDLATAEVVGRTAIAVHPGWEPVGPAVGWVAGGALLADADGRIGAVARGGDVRWVAASTWSWQGVGDGTDWVVVTADGGGVARRLVVDGRDGTVVRDLGPAAAIHDPVVADGFVAWVDLFAGVDRGTGRPIAVQAVTLDGTGRTWAATGLPPTTGVPDAVQLDATADGVVVHYQAAGQATSATWLDAGGATLGFVSVGGAGRTDEGWPVATVFGDVLAHVDPVRREVRVVDRGGVIRWAVPARAGEGVVGDGDAVVVRTPPRDTSLQSRVRVVDTERGRLRWDRLEAGTEAQRFTTSLDGHVGVATTATTGLPVTAVDWFALESGRRRGGAALLGGVLDLEAADVAGLEVVGRVAVGAVVRPVVRRLDGRPFTDAAAAVDWGDVGRSPGPEGADVADDELAVRVGPASLRGLDPTSGDVRWEAAASVALAGPVALLDEVVVALGRDGIVRGWDRADGRLAWRGPSDVTALTAGGQEVVVGTRSGEVVVLDADGGVLQSIRVGLAAVEDVAVVDGMVVATVGQDVVGLGRGARFVEPVDRVEVP